jgi:exosortase/archaeosortase family protein
LFKKILEKAKFFGIIKIIICKEHVLEMRKRKKQVEKTEKRGVVEELGFDSKTGVEKAGKFVFSITVLFIVFNFLFDIIGVQRFEVFYANGALAILSLLGFSGKVVEYGGTLLILNGFDLPFAFGYLCTGLLELALIWSAVLSTTEVGFKKRLFGLVAATFTLVVFNLARIVSSIIIIKYFGLDVGNFSHDLLFKVFLFATIAGFYYVWLKNAD